MKRIAEAIELARSCLAERVSKSPTKRPPRYDKAEDAPLLALSWE